jgi:Flp pilus assembly protein TadD
MLLALDANSPEVHYYLGMSKAHLGDVDGAIADFFRSIELGSRDNHLMTGLSFAYLKAGKKDKSLVYANLAL